MLNKNTFISLPYNPSFKRLFYAICLLSYKMYYFNIKES